MSDFDHIFYQARLYRARYEYARAEEFCVKALEIEPNHMGALSLLGRLKAIQGHHEKAREIFAGAARLEPRNPAILIDLATSHRGLGDFEGARAVLEKAIGLDKTFAPAFYMLAGIVKFEPNDPLIDDFVQLKKKVYSNPQWRCAACFALGKIYDDVGEWDLAFENYAEGNALRPARYDYGHKKHLLNAIKQRFTPELMQDADISGHSSPAPVFIIGLPRSGSSLIEELLSRSPAIAGLGEPHVIEDLFAAAFQHVPGVNGGFSIRQAINNHQFSDLGADYLERMTKIASGAQRMIDKNLFNHTLTGFIRLILPNAAIIHAKRDPIDTCLSCYFQRFTEGHDYSFSLENLGRHFAAYDGIMHHWDALFGAKIYSAQYENIVADKDAAIKALFAHIDMPLPDAAALAAPADRAIPTASAWQARQPIYQSSVKRWKNYEKHLGPLFRSLEEAGFQYENH